MGHARAYTLCYVVTCVVDVIGNALLYLSTHNWEMTAPSWEASQLWQITDNTVDCVILVVFRCLVVSLLGLIAIRVGRPRPVTPQQGTQNIQGYVLVDCGDMDDEADRLRKASEQKKHGDKKKNIVLAMLFVLLTSFSVFTGIKCIVYKFTEEALQGACMGTLVLWINLEFYFMKALVDDLTLDEGIISADLHPHPLHFRGDVVRARCDQCNTRIKKESYQCKKCDFDCCLTCFKKAKKSQGESMLRGDKGMREEVTITNTGYMLRAIRLTLPFGHLVFVAFLCLFVNQGARLFLPNFQGKIIDSVVHTDHDTFWSSLKFYIVLSTATGFFGGIRSLCVSLVARKISNAVKNELFRSLIRQDIAFFDGTTTGHLTARMTNDANAMVSPCRTLLNNMLANLILLIGGLVMCFITSWKLSMLAFTSVGPIVYVTGVYAKWSRNINRQIWDALAEANSTATEGFSNIRTVRSFSTEDTEIEKFESATAEALRKGIKDAFASAGTYAFTNYLDLGAGVLILAYGGVMAMRNDGELTIGKLITFQLYANMMANSYQALNGVLNSFTRAAGAAQRVLSMMYMLPDIDPSAGTQLETLQGNMQLRSVDFFYQMRPEKPVLNAVDLDIPAGKVTALVGRSGGGKSTIVHMLMRFYDPVAGAVMLDGRDITELNVRWLHKHMGLVAQDTQLFATTILDNITYGKPEATMEEVQVATRAANAHDFIMEFDDGYRTRVGERGVRLSGGQKQRIAIARVLLLRPRLLFLDEATSALDTESEALVQQALDTLISEVHSSCTIVLVAHRLSTVVNADNIAVIDAGRVVEQGTHDILVAQDGVYSKLVSKQLTRDQNQIDDTPEDGGPDVAEGGGRRGGKKGGRGGRGGRGRDIEPEDY